MMYWGKSIQVEGTACTKSLMWDKFGMPGGEMHIKVARQRWRERQGKMWFDRGQIMADLGGRVRILDIILQVMGSTQVFQMFSQLLCEEPTHPRE